MDAIICNNCQNPLVNNAIFCSDCGARQACKACFKPLVKGAKFCIECGEEVNAKSADSSRNTVVYRRTKDEIYCNVNLSDEVGKNGLQALIQGITGNPEKPLEIGFNSAKSPVQDVDFREVEDNKKNIQNSEPKETKIPDDFKPNKEPLADESYPHLDDLSFKKEFTEMEWILIFAFYQSDFGRGTFTKDQVQSSYLDKRKTLSRQKNFSGNWIGLRKTFFTTKSEGVYAMSSDKLKLVSDLIFGRATNITKGAYIKPTSSAPKKNALTKTESPSGAKPKSSTKNVDLEEFDVFKEDNKPSLQEFYEKYKPNNNKSLIGMIAFYICVFNKAKVFTAGNIDYACKILKVPRKNNLVQIVNNLKNETQWFDGDGSGIWKLKRLGEVDLEKMFSN